MVQKLQYALLLLHILQFFILEEAIHTATFLDRIDKLFNCFNSRSLHSKAQMGHPISATSGHHEFLEDTLAWLKTVQSRGMVSVV